MSRYARRISRYEEQYSCSNESRLTTSGFPITLPEDVTISYAHEAVMLSGEVRGESAAIPCDFLLRSYRAVIDANSPTLGFHCLVALDRVLARHQVGQRDGGRTYTNPLDYAEMPP